MAGFNVEQSLKRGFESCFIERQMFNGKAPNKVKI